MHNFARWSQVVLPILIGALAILSLNPFPFGRVNVYGSAVLSFFVLVICLFNRKSLIIFNRAALIGAAIISSFLIYISLLPTHDGGHKGWFLLIPIVVLFSALKIEVLKSSLKVFSVLFFLSLAPQILEILYYLFGGSSQLKPIAVNVRQTEAEFYLTNGISVFLNLVTFQQGHFASYVLHPEPVFGRFLTRLTGFFDEPGVVGTVCGLLCCVKEVRKGWLGALNILVGTLSFSLAFYLLFLMSLPLYKKPLVQIGKFAALLAIVVTGYSSSGGYFFVRSMLLERVGAHNVGDQVFKHTLMSESDREFYETQVFGKQFGLNANQRESDAFQRLFERYMNSDLKTRILGLASDANGVWGGNNYSFRLIFTNYGFLGFCFVVAFFISVLTSGFRRVDTRILLPLLIFSAAALQRPFFWMPATMLILLCFVRDKKQGEV